MAFKKLWCDPPPRSWLTEVIAAMQNTLFLCQPLTSLGQPLECLVWGQHNSQPRGDETSVVFKLLMPNPASSSV